MTISSLSYIEGTTLGTAEEIYEVAGRASDMGLVGIGDVSEQQASGVYMASFAAGSLTGIGRGGSRIELVLTIS